LSDPAETEPYSKAFETLIREPEDIVGILAYGFFKTSIRERVRSGQDVPRHLRNPTKSETDAFRGQAERILERYAAQAIADAEPAITAAAHGMAKNEIITEIRNRTGIGPSIGTGVIVWIVTILLTMAVVFAAPDWVRGLVEHVSPQMNGPPSPHPSVTSPSGNPGLTPGNTNSEPGR
jgi:hypothetical protein